MYPRSTLVFKILVLLCFSGSLLFAQSPMLINYQGKLNMPGMAAEDSTNMTFIIYDDSVAINQPVWSKEYENIRLSEGVFKILLGPFPPEVFNGSGERWLEINVGSQRLLPRYRLVSVPYAIRASQADSSIKSQSAVYADSSLKAYQSVKSDTARWVLSATGVLDGHSLDAADGDPSDAVFVDNEGNVGIGTLTPTAKLEVNGTAHIKGHADSTGVYVDSSGLVGIGTTNPETKLHVTGDKDVAIRVSSTGSGSEVAAFQMKKNNVSWAVGVGGPGTHYGGEGGIGFRQSIGSTVHNTRMVIDSTGKVGIRTTTPLKPLHIRAVESNAIVVQSSTAYNNEAQDLLNQLPNGSYIIGGPYNNGFYIYFKDQNGDTWRLILQGEPFPSQTKK